MQAKKLVEAYIGKWMNVASSVRDVGSDYIILDLGKHTLVLMTFDIKWKDQLSVLRRDSHIKAIGQIKDVDGNDVILKNCEIINSLGC